MIATAIVAHIERVGLQPDYLLFAIRGVASLGRPRLRALPAPETLGLTEPQPRASPVPGTGP